MVHGQQMSGTDSCPVTVFRRHRQTWPVVVDWHDVDPRALELSSGQSDAEAVTNQRGDVILSWRMIGAGKNRGATS